MSRAMRSSPRAHVIPVVASLCVPVIAWGMWVRDDRYLSSDSGLGYGLGVAGLAAMTVLLLYSARKRVRVLRGAGSIRPWFEIHMLLGILGPVAILFHSNFRIGSLNSTIALACTLLVSGSGLVGRVIYTRVHYGLSTRRRTLADLRVELDALRGDLERIAGGAETHLRELEALALRSGEGVVSAIVHGTRVASRARALRRVLRREIRRAAGGTAPAAQRASLESTLEGYLASVAAVSRLSLYERVFALWHAFHLPLCFLLYASAAGHVVAVHLY